MSLDEVRGSLEWKMCEHLASFNLPALRDFTLGDGKTHYGHPSLLTALCRRWIEREVAAILREPKRAVVFPRDLPALPEHLKYFGMQPALDGDALRRIAPFLALMPQATGGALPPDPADPYKKFEALSSALLRSSGSRAARNFLRVYANGGLGESAAHLEEHVMTHVLMALLRERRLAEAIGVCTFVFDAPDWMQPLGGAYDHWRLDLFQHCGLDWETAITLPGHQAFFAAAGSEKVARAALTGFLGKPDHADWWTLDQLVAFVPPRGANEDDPRTRLPSELQTAILKQLCDSVGEDVPFRLLHPRIETLVRLKRPETKETLLRLANHPSPTVAQRARFALDRMDENVAYIPPALPVRFRIFHNGEPWRMQELDASPGGTVVTDAEGILQIPRDVFLDPEGRGPDMVFSKFPSWSAYGASAHEQYNLPWVRVALPRPRAFDEVTRVDFTTCALPIEIRYASPPVSAGHPKASIRLLQEDKRGPNDSGFWMYFNDQIPPPERLTLGRLQPGDYRLAILAPGSARWLSDRIEVKPGMAPIAVQLERGSDLSATLRVPENARGAWEIRLYRGEEDVTPQYVEPRGADPNLNFEGVPRGQYQLRILSTAEYMAKQGLTEWKAPQFPGDWDPRDGVDCTGLKIDFTIDDSSPANFDLGRLENPPVATQREQVTQWRIFSGRPPP